MRIDSLNNSIRSAQNLPAAPVPAARPAAPAPQPQAAAVSSIQIDAQALLSRMARLLDTLQPAYGQSADPRPSHLDVLA